MHINIEEIEKAKLDEMVVNSIARRLSKLALEAKTHNIKIFGGSGSGSLRFTDGGDGELILAHLDGNNWDGGDGATNTNSDGLERGEL